MSEVIVYVEADYEGASAVLGPGRYQLDEDLNDKISTLRVPEGLTATLFENPDFSGQERVFRTDAASIDGDFGDQTSSIIVSPVKQATDFTVTNEEIWNEETTTTVSFDVPPGIRTGL